MRETCLLRGKRLLAFCSCPHLSWPGAVHLEIMSESSESSLKVPLNDVTERSSERSAGDKDFNANKTLRSSFHQHPPSSSSFLPPSSSSSLLQSPGDPSDPLLSAEITTLEAVGLFLTTPHRLSSHLSKLSNPDSRSNVYVASWRILSTITSILCLYLLSQNVLAFFTFDTTTEIHPVSNRQPLPYPAVTVCNNNVIRVTPDLPESLQWFCNSTSNWYDKDMQAVLTNLTDQDLLQYGSQLPDFVVYCSINGEECEDDDWTTTVPDGYGTGACHTLNPSDRFPPPEGIGSYFPISLRLFIDEDAYCGSISESAGVKIIVHPSNAYPDPSQAMSISPSTLTSIGFRRRNIIRQEWPFGNCEEGPPYQSADPCFDKCVIDKVESECGCRYSKAVRYDDIDLPYCEWSDQLLACGEKVESDWLKGKDDCECPRPRCEEVMYDLQSSTSRWPSKATKDILLRDPDLWFMWDNIDEYVATDLFFSSFQYTEEKTIPQTSFATMLSNIGGTLGLCLGMSLVSVVELMELGVLVGRRMRMSKDPRRVQESDNVQTSERSAYSTASI